MNSVLKLMVSEMSNCHLGDIILHNTIQDQVKQPLKQVVPGTTVPPR